MPINTLYHLQPVWLAAQAGMRRTAAYARPLPALGHPQRLCSAIQAPPIPHAVRDEREGGASSRLRASNSTVTMSGCRSLSNAIDWLWWLLANRRRHSLPLSNAIWTRRKYFATQHHRQLKLLLIAAPSRSSCGRWTPTLTLANSR